MVISWMNKVDFIKQDDIIYLKSAGRYTEFHVHDKKNQVLATKPIGEFENSLDKHTILSHSQFIYHQPQSSHKNQQSSRQLLRNGQW